MIIKKMIIKNFRGYKYAEINFNDFNCIVGKNDVGKSTIIEALKFFLNTDKKAKDDDFNHLSLTEYDSTENYNGENDISYHNPISVEVVFGSDLKIENINNNTYCFKNDFVDDGTICIKKNAYHSDVYMNFEEAIDEPVYEIKCRMYDSMDCPYSLVPINDLGIMLGRDIASWQYEFCRDYNGWEYFIRRSEFEQELYAQLTRDKNSNWRYYPMDDFDITFPILKILDDKSSINDYANVLLNNHRPDELSHYKQAIESIDYVRSYFAKIVSDKLGESVSFSGGYDFLANSIITTYEGIPLDNRGDGTKSKVLNAIFEYITDNEWGKKDYILVFEEPENHLHPTEQIKRYEALKQLSSNPSYQIIVTTHSPAIVSRCDVREIIHVVKENNISEVKQNDSTSLKEVIEDLGIFQNDLMASLYDSVKCLFLVEGPDDVKAFNHLSEQYKSYGKIEKTFKELGCVLVPVGGCDSIKHWSTAEVIKNLHKNFYVVLDSDKKEQDASSDNLAKLAKYYGADSANYRVLRKRELENYIPCSYFNENPEISKYGQLNYGDWDDVKKICKENDEKFNHKLGGKYVAEWHFDKLTFEQLRSTFCPSGNDCDDEFLDIYRIVSGMCNV